ncbi:hypothetical protein Tco_1214943 [Tanacetum coccineum]
MDYGLEYSGDPLVLEGYTDASWITDQEDYASTSGWIFTLGGGTVSWGSKKQSCLTDSTMAAEFVALASCCKEAEWLRDLLINIPLWLKPMPPISMRCDSQYTLSRAYNQVYNGKSRYIGLRHSYGNNLDKVHLSGRGSAVSSYELKGLALKHSEKPRYRPMASFNGSAQK